MADVNAIRAKDLTSSVGVNTHINSSDAYSNLSQLESDLNYLGVSNVRDSASTAGDDSVWLAVANATGVKFDDFIGETSVSNMYTELGYMSGLASEGILNYIEGGNEEDNGDATSQGNSLGATVGLQQQLYNLGQSLGLPVINMSFGSGWTSANDWHGNYDKVGDLSYTTNYGNAHTYPFGAPGSAIQQVNADAKLAAGYVPVITTELGYSQDAHDQTMIAKYSLDAILDAKLYGDTKSYFYALYDDQSGAWGLFNSDGSARPVANAIHNMQTLLADNGGNAGSFSTSSLDESLSGTIGGDNSLLTEKSDGSFWLALWNETAGYDHTVTVNLGSTASSVQVFDPLNGTYSIESLSNVSSVSVDLPDHPILVEIVPGGSANASPATSADTPPASTTPASTTSDPGTSTPDTSTPDTSSGGPVIDEASDQNSVVATVDGTTVNLNGGYNTVFLDSTGNTVNASSGQVVLSGFAGGNTVTLAGGNDTVRLAGSGSVIDLKGQYNSIEESGSGNTFVLETGSNDDIYGYPFASNDSFDLRHVLANTDWNGDNSTVGQYIKVIAMGDDTSLQVSPTAYGTSVQLADVHSSGYISAATFLAHAIV